MKEIFHAKKRNTTNCVKLLQTDIPPILFIVDKRLVPGFYLLAELECIERTGSPDYRAGRRYP